MYGPITPSLHWKTLQQKRSTKFKKDFNLIFKYVCITSSLHPKRVASKCENKCIPSTNTALENRNVPFVFQFMQFYPLPGNLMTVETGWSLQVKDFKYEVKSTYWISICHLDSELTCILCNPLVSNFLWIPPIINRVKFITTDAYHAALKAPI